MMILILLAFFVLAYFIYAVITTYSNVGDLEHTLGMTKAKTQFAGSSVIVSGIYRGVFTTIRGFLNFAPWNANNNKIVYTMQHCSTFNATISAGEGFGTKELQEKKRLAKEESAKKVWNPNLTQEEKRIIEERRKTRGDSEEVANKDEFKIVSATLRDVNHYLDQDGRREVVASLLRKGILSINISRSDISMEFDKANSEEFKAPNMEKTLKEMQKLIVEKADN